MHRILITGINGFIGKNLVSFLQKQNNIQIYGLVRSKVNSNYVNNGIKEFLDESDLSDLSCFNSIVHLAGKAHDLKNTLSEKEYITINYELTKKIFDLYVNSGSEKFIFISSVKAAADSVDDILTENELPKPVTPYGKSKLKAEEYILKIAVESNKSFHILRPCIVHGPFNKGNLNLLFNLVKKGIPYPLGSIENKRSLLSVDNLSFVISEIIESNIPPGTYNVSDDEIFSTNDLVKLIGKALNKKARILNVNPKIIKAATLIGDKLGLQFNSENLKKLTENYIVSNSKIKNALGKPFPITGEEGLLKTFRSFL